MDVGFDAGATEVALREAMEGLLASEVFAIAEELESLGEVDRDQDTFQVRTAQEADGFGATVVGRGLQETQGLRLGRIRGGALMEERHSEGGLGEVVAGLGAFLQGEGDRGGQFGDAAGVEIGGAGDFVGEERLGRLDEERTEIVHVTLAANEAGHLTAGQQLGSLGVAERGRLLKVDEGLVTVAREAATLEGVVEGEEDVTVAGVGERGEERDGSGEVPVVDEAAGLGEGFAAVGDLGGGRGGGGHGGGHKRVGFVG
jgi:hypothetical protein